MAHRDLGMGQLDLISTTSGLQLQVSSSAYFAPLSWQEDSQSHLDSVRTPACFSAMFTIPWIARHAGYGLTIRLHFPPDLDQGRRDGVVERLASALYGAELWEQLELEPTSQEVTTMDTGCHVITLSLAHAHRGLSSARPPRHKFAGPGVCGNVQIPPAVATVEVERVVLEMRFGTDPSWKRKKAAPSSSVPGMIERTGSIGAADSDVGLLELEAEVRGWLAHGRTTTAGQRTCSDRIPMVTNGHSIPSMAPLERNGLFVDRRDYMGPPTSLGIKRSHGMSVIQPTINSNEYEISSQDILELFDAGLRCSIVAKPKGLSKGIQVVSHESFKRLSSIMPSLWSPGYFSGVSTRAVMLPTVSHALSNVCGKHARSATLRNKLAELARRTSASEICGGNPQDVQQTITACLWQAVRYGLLDDHRAAACLKPLDMLAGDGLDQNVAWPVGVDGDQVAGRDHTMDVDGYGSDGSELLELEENNVTEWDRTSASDASGTADRAPLVDHGLQYMHGTSQRASEDLDEDDVLSLSDHVMSVDEMWDMEESFGRHGVEEDLIPDDWMELEVDEILEI